MHFTKFQTVEKMSSFFFFISQIDPFIFFKVGFYNDINAFFFFCFFVVVAIPLQVQQYVSKDASFCFASSSLIVRIIFFFKNKNEHLSRTTLV